MKRLAFPASLSKQRGHVPGCGFLGHGWGQRPPGASSESLPRPWFGHLIPLRGDPGGAVGTAGVDLCWDGTGTVSPSGTRAKDHKTPILHGERWAAQFPDLEWVMWTVVTRMD